MDDQLEQDVARLWALLFAAVLDGERRIAENLSQHNLTVPQFYVLKTLSERGGRWGIGQIARAHGLTNATMTGLISRMEAMDPPLVLRETSATDRRAVHVVLTEAGRERFDAVTRSLADQLRSVVALIPAEDRRRLLDELEHYAQLVLSLSNS